MRTRPAHRLLSCVLSTALSLSLLVLPASASSGSLNIQVDYKNIVVTLDGSPLALTDAKGATVEPFAYQGTTYLPLRAVAGALGLEVAWDPATSTVALTSGGTRSSGAVLPPAGTTATVSIKADYKDIKVTLDGAPLALTDAKGNEVEPFAYQGTTYLPLRAVAGALGLTVAWDAASSTVALTSGAPAGSSDPGGYSADKAQRYMQGILDNWYYGTYTEQYLEESGSSPEWAKEIYEDSIQVEVDEFTSCIDIDYPDDVNDRLVELWTQISAKASYTVSPATGPDADGTYSVKVTVKPLDIYKLIDEAYPAFKEAFEAPYKDLDFESMTEEEYQDWYKNEYDKVYRDGLCDLLETLVPKIGYLPEESITVRVERDSEGYYGLNPNDNSELASMIISPYY